MESGCDGHDHSSCTAGGGGHVETDMAYSPAKFCGKAEWWHERRSTETASVLGGVGSGRGYESEVSFKVSKGLRGVRARAPHESGCARGDVRANTVAGGVIIWPSTCTANILMITFRRAPR